MLQPYFSVKVGYLFMVILAQDPSFNALAYSLYDGKDTIYVDNSTSKLGEGIGFDKVYNACSDLLEQYISKLNKLGVGESILIDKYISEIPPPVGNFSAGLYALDTYIISNIFKTYTSIKEVYMVPPSYLGTVHGTAKYKKSDSTKLAKYFINEILKDDFKVVIPDSISASGRKTKGAMNNDRAESFLFLLRMFCKYDIKGYRNKIMSEMSGLGYEAEKILCTRN